MSGQQTGARGPGAGGAAHGRQGLIHVYYGDGKGKTTAALGLALRASGAGMRVLIAQLLKDDRSGELAQLKRLPGVTVLPAPAAMPFPAQMGPTELAQTAERHNAMLREALSRCASGACGLLVLDEALDACRYGLLDEALLRRAVLEKPPALELVVTGHKPVDWVIERADYVTEMVCRRHPYARGVPARRGIEF